MKTKKSLEERLAEAKKIIQNLDNHEGAEGWSQHLIEDLEAFWKYENEAEREEQT